MSNGAPLDTLWTDSRTAALKQLWADGLSASQIAGELGSGLSRSAVISKAHRLNLGRRAKSPASGARGGDTYGTVKLPRGALGPGANKSRVVSLLRRANTAATECFGIGGVPKHKFSRKPITLAHGAPKIEPGEIDELVDEAPIAPVVKVDRTGVTLVDLTPTSCRWPVGTPGVDLFFCGAPGADVEHRQPYCAGTLCRRFMTTTGEAWR